MTEAHGLFPVLPEDKDNLFITFSARQLNPRLRIVARVKDLLVNGPKFRLAGADVVVSPAFSGGLRLASEAARPHATDFLDLLLRDTACEMNLRELTLPAGSFPCGRSLAHLELTRRHRVLILAVRPAGADLPSYNPSAATVLLAGDRLALYGRLSDLNALETRIREEGAPAQS